MKKLFTIFMLLTFYSVSSTFAQFVISQGISKTNIDLSSETTLGQVTINPTSAGKVIVHFDGQCIADVGDRIVLAASNTTSWGVNDGSVAVEATDADVNRKPFSHTRVYDVIAGSQTFYAVAHNYVETDGSGIASIYGTLTAEFVPAGAFLVGFQGISKTNIDLSSKTTLGQVTINPTTAGKVIIHFDGQCISDVGDRIVLAASNATSWGVNDGNVGVEAVNADVNGNSFSHTRVYDVVAGSQTFYALAHNYVETDGSGIASIYGSLTVKFIPTGASEVGFQGISKTNIDLSSETTVGQVTINPTTAGKVIVHFDGQCISDVGDRIVLAASNTTSWGVNDGNIGVEAANADVNGNSFSHTRVYDVVAGSQTFYAVAHNYVETDGSGIASIYSSLTVEFIPNAITTVVENNDENSLSVYPNPAKDNIFIEFADYKNSNVTILNAEGQILQSFDLQDAKTQVNLDNYATGLYIMNIIGDKGSIVKKIIKN